MKNIDTTKSCLSCYYFRGEHASNTEGYCDMPLINNSAYTNIEYIYEPSIFLCNQYNSFESYQEIEKLIAKLEELNSSGNLRLISIDNKNDITDVKDRNSVAIGKKYDSRGSFVTITLYLNGASI